MNMAENTLNVKRMEIVNTDNFLENFIGMPITIWKNAQPFYFSMENMEGYRFESIGSGECIIIFGYRSAFCCGIDDGFGLKVRGKKEHVWVDRMNRKEMAIIIYDNTDGEVLA